MKRAGYILPKARRRKWLRRGLLAGAAVVAAGVAAPFVFTGAVVRYWLAHSAYRDMPLRFGSATLSPLGRLTVHDLEIDDAGEGSGEGGGGGGRRWLRADKAQLAFSWRGLWANHFASVELENLELSLHSGRDTPLTLLRMLAPPAPGDPAASSGGGTSAVGADGGGGGGGHAFWCDEILATGQVRLTGYDTWLALADVRNNEPVALQLAVKAADGPAPALRDVSLILGEADAAARPFLTARFTVQAGVQGTVLNVERLNLGNVSPAVTGAMLRAWPGLPAALRREAAGHLERLIVSGSATLGGGGREITVNATAELRDLTAQAGAFSVEHFSAAAHVGGKITAAPLKDLQFSRAHCSWDALQAGDWRLERGAADFAVEGAEIVLTDMQAQWADADVAATAAWDTAGGIVSRGRLWVSGVSARALRARLPAGMRARIPDVFDGTLAARVFLSESDAEHMAAHVEVACPDELAFNMSTPAEAGAGGAGANGAAATNGAAGTTTAGKPAAKLEPTVMWAGAILTNALVSGTVSWNLRADSRPELAHGRLTADELLVMPTAARRSMEGTALSRIKADFNITGNLARLDDFYADLSGNGRLAIEGNYALDDQSLEDVVLSLNGIDLTLANPWLPEGWSLTGQMDAEWRGAISPRAAALDASLGLSPHVALKGPEAALSVSGAPPVAALRLAADRRTGATQVQAAEISGLDAIRADAGFVKLLRKALAPADDSALGVVFDRIGDGAYISCDKVGFTGHFGPADAGGTVSCSGLDLGIGTQGGDTDKPPTLVNLTLKADVAAALLPGGGVIPDAATLRVSGGQFLAEKVSLGQNAFTGLSGNFAAEKGKVFLTHGALSVAEGTMEGDATLGLDGRIEALHLGFTGLRQQALLRNLYPEVFTAEGPVSGQVTLQRGGEGDTGRDGRLSGAIEVTAEQPGRLKISGAAARSSLTQLAQAVVNPADAVWRDNSGALAEEQLADYPYLEGKATLRDEAAGLRLTLDYARQPLKAGDPGYGVPATVAGQPLTANVIYQLRGGSVTLHGSVAEVLGRLLGFGAAAQTKRGN